MTGVQTCALPIYEELQKWIADAGLSVVEKLDIAPKHAKSTDQSDPLYLARAKEMTSLYRLKANKLT